MKAPRRKHVVALVLAAALAVGAAAFTVNATSATPATAPVISGTAQAGETLTTTNGTWTGTPTSFAYQWQRCGNTGTACANISGANANTYVPTSADVGNTDRVVVTATEGAVVTDSASAVTAVIVSGGPTNSLPPSVSGTPTEGQTLIAANGTWAGAAPITFTYAWSRCDATGAACAAITGATNNSYVLASADAGKTVRLAVTAKNTLGSETQITGPTATIARLNPASLVVLPSGARSIDVTDVSLPDQLIIDKVSFSPNPLRSRAAFTAKVHISDSRGFVVRNAIVFVEGLPFGRASQPPETKTGSDGTATLTLHPTSKLPLQNGATLVMFIRARKAGDQLIAGVSARRLVNLRVVPA
jgi:hypothetical protein